MQLLGSQNDMATIRLPGRDSDLEAFSLNPSDGSFAALAFRPAT